jgi:uncharacterized membrane protein (TIGR02234 family)
MRSLRASKGAALLAVALLGGAGMLAWSMPWFTVTLVAGASLDPAVTVSGDAAAPALVPLSLAALALVGALAIASPVVRSVLAVLLALLGVGMVVVGATATLAPSAAISSTVTEATGLEGDRAVDAAVASISPSPWPVFAIAIGALVIVASIWILASSRAWPGASRRYDAPTGNDGAPASTPSVEPASSTVSDWDSLSAGEDPTGTPDAR